MHTTELFSDIDSRKSYNPLALVLVCILNLKSICWFGLFRNDPASLRYMISAERHLAPGGIFGTTFSDRQGLALAATAR